MQLSSIRNSNPTTRGPLSPLNMLIAGVPARDVVWFKRLSPGEQMRSLSSSERGANILSKVREHEMRKCSAAMPQAA